MPYQGYAKKKAREEAEKVRKVVDKLQLWREGAWRAYIGGEGVDYVKG